MLDFCESSICHIQRLIRNYIWSGKGGHARAKVAWTTLILPKSKGGLGLIDPEDQSKALLAQLIVKGKLPGTEPWKMLLKDRMQGFSPQTGGGWPENDRWMWVKECKLHTSRKWEDMFFNSLVTAWQAIRERIVYNTPAR